MITVRGLCGGYGDKTVLRDLTLAIHPGDFVALLGPNGSGKSTLLKIMAGQLAPTAGEVQLAGRALRDYTPRARSLHVAYFPQSRPTPHMDVGTLVAHGRFPRLGFGRVLGAADRAAVHDAMAQTGLLELAHRPLASLSGGERQRAYLAMLIAQEAQVLLLDEPGSFLDIGHQLDIMDILRALNGRGRTIVFAAHDLPLAFTYAKRIVLLADGRLAGDAPPRLMAEEPAVGQIFGVRVAAQPDDALFSYRLERGPGV